MRHDPALAQTLLRLRHQQGLSQWAVGAKANLTGNHVGRVERGESSPTWGTLSAITHALGLSMSELVAAVEQQH